MLKALTVALVTAALMALASAQEPIAVGIVREDGYLMPITLITPKLLEDHPLPAQTLVNGEPIDAPALEAPAQSLGERAWTLAPGRGAKPIALRTLDSQMISMPDCSDRLMWRTTLKRPPVDEGYAPIRKLGMAVSGASIAFPDEVANLPDATSRRVARRIVSLFLTREKARLAKESGPLGVSSAPDSPPVVIKVLKRYTTRGVTTYYFEATKALKLSEGVVDPSAGLVTGWIVDSAAGLKDYEVTYKINDEAYKENERAIVRGIVPHRGRALWLLEWHGWEDEYYTLHDWPSGVVRATLSAYEC